MKNILNILIVITITISYGNAQFESLVKKAWDNNKSLQAQHFSLDQAGLAMKEAQAMYGPSVAANFQYTLAAGGRNIEFPIGDLLNPAYDALNKITNTNDFPSLQNQSINFLPNNFYDAKVRVQQPIYYPDLAINKEVKQYQYNIKSQEIKAMKRLLSKEVMNTAIQITLAEKALGIFQENKKLIEEAKRTTNSMLKNGIALPSALSRIDAQLASLLEQEITTTNGKKNAERYLYFLTNDTLTEEIRIFLESSPVGINLNTNIREELLQLDEAMKIYNAVIKKESFFYKPRIGAQLDLGSQAFNFGLSPYALLGVNLDLNLFDNKRNKIRNDIAKVSLTEHNTKRDYIQDQLNLQADISQNNLIAAIDQANTYAPRIASAAKVYKEVFIKYKEGTANYLELVDAQTQLTNSQIQANLAKYTSWLKWSEHYYNTAQFNIQ
jgi:outer membrane protein TolC